MDKITSRLALTLLAVAVLSTVITTFAFYHVKLQLEQRDIPQTEMGDSSSGANMAIRVVGNEQPVKAQKQAVPDNAQVAISIK